MAVKIRLMRVGKKKQPTYRVVVADGRSPRDGRFIEIIGQYAPRAGARRSVEIDADSALAWLRKGAQPTEQVQKLLTVTGRVGAVRGRAQAAVEVPSSPPRLATGKVERAGARRPQPTPAAAAPPPRPWRPRTQPAAEDVPAAESPRHQPSEAADPARRGRPDVTDEEFDDTYDDVDDDDFEDEVGAEGNRIGGARARRGHRVRHPQPGRRPRRDRGRRRGASAARSRCWCTPTRATWAG